MVVVVYQVSLWCLARKVVLLVEEKQLFHLYLPIVCIGSL
jgi:hypothetical protein